MPAIQAYKHKGKLIPVDEAKIGRAYRCAFTGTLFGTKAAYVKHLKVLRQERMWRNARHNRWQRKMEDLWNQTSFEKIVRWIELNPDEFWYNAQKRGFAGDRDRYERVRGEFSVRITYLDLRWSDSVSNTHSCPHNGVTNWSSRDDDKPKGYPGWQGRIEYELSHDLPGFGCDLMIGTRIHTGTGGGNGTNYGFDVCFFADDWPGLAKGQVWDALKGSITNRVQYGKPRYFR